MVPIWACDVTDVLAQRVTEEMSCVRIIVTSQAQHATIDQI